MTFKLMLPLPSICAPEKKNTSMRPWPALSNSSRPPSVHRLCSGLCCSDTLGASGARCWARNAAAAGIGELAPTAICRAPAISRSTTSISTSSGRISAAVIGSSRGAAAEDVLVEVAAEAGFARGGAQIVHDVRGVLGVEVAEFERSGTARRHRDSLDIESRNGRRGHHLVGEQVAVMEPLNGGDAALRGMGESEEIAPAADPDIAVAVGQGRMEQRHVGPDRRQDDR